jgi:hypothetical protein
MRMNNLLLAFIGVTGCAASAWADVVVVPPEYQSVPGNTSRNTPLRDLERSMQFVVAASELSSVAMGTAIVGLSWRLPGSAAASWPPVDAFWQRYDIEVATSLNPPSSFSLTYAANIGLDSVLVRSGPLTMPAGAYTHGSSPNAFGAAIPFTTPFVYQGGDLVFTIRHSGNTLGSNAFADCVSSAVPGYGTRFLYLDNLTADATEGINRSMFPVIQILTGSAQPPCYANCDGSTTAPVLNVEDFSCFINEFAAAQLLPHEQQLTHYANCDESTTAPVLNVEDFTCFINAFAQGCP